MNSRQRKTLLAIFHEPAPANVRWSDAVSLLVSLGAMVSNRGGSMVAVSLRSVRVLFHRPHPGDEMSRGMVRKLREYLEGVGIRPDTGSEAE
jgi:hypothetical protein